MNYQHDFQGMDFPYEQQHVVLTPGDTLLLYTDGVSEAMDEAGRLFKESRIGITRTAFFAISKAFFKFSYRILPVILKPSNRNRVLKMAMEALRHEDRKALYHRWCGNHGLGR